MVPVSLTFSMGELNNKYKPCTMKRLIQIIIYTYFLLTTDIANAQNKLTLQQAVETGIANNLLVQQSNYQMQREEITWKQSRLNRLPDLNANANQGTNRGRSIDPFTNSYINEKVGFANYGLSSGVLLFNGLSLHNNIKQNALAFEASKMELQQEKDNLTMNIILAYLQVLQSEEIMNQSRNQVTLTTSQVERMVLLNNEGAIVPSVLSDLRGQLSGDQVSVIDAENALVSAKISLCQLMNVSCEKDMQVEKLEASSFASKYDISPGDIFTIASKQFALIKAAELRKQSAARAVKAIKGQLFPTLSLNGSLGTNYSSIAMQNFFINTTDVVSDDYVLVNGNPSPVIKKQSNFNSEKIRYTNQLDNNLSTSVFINLNIPIFNSFFVRNRVKLAKIDLKNNEKIEQTAKTQLRQNIDLAHTNMTTAFDRYKTLLEQVKAYEESFRAAEIRFTEGVGTTIDYLTAKNNLDRASINLITAKYDYVLRTKILDYYQGRPLF